MTRFVLKTLCCVVWGVLPAIAAGATQSANSSVTTNLNVLRNSNDPVALEKAAVALARAGDSRAVLRLGEFLGRGEFLARLDNLRTDGSRTLHLREVMVTLAAHPIPAVAYVCVMLSKNKTFVEDEDRMDALLETLAAVRPMSPVATALFRETNAQGYFAFNAPLLVKNGSPHALELFESMIRDREVTVNRRIDSIHQAVLPYRTSLPVLDSVARLLSGDLEQPVAIGLIETLFDYRSKQWFGPAVGAPRPPQWDSASKEALRAVLRLSEQVMGYSFLPQDLATVVRDTAVEVQQTLEMKTK